MKKILCSIIVFIMCFTISNVNASNTFYDTRGTKYEGVVERMAKLGIVNGIDVDYYNPVNDTVIASKFDSKNLDGKAICKKELQRLAGLPENSRIPVISMVSRLASHKGFDLVKFILPEMLELGMQCLFVKY